MPEFPDLLILRHGETQWNRDGRMQGRLDSPLTETGQVQARGQGAAILAFGAAGWDWVSSPQGRALQTAQIAARAADVPVQSIRTDDRLSEIHVGDWTGAMRDDIRTQRPDLFEKTELGWYDHAPGGEGLVGLAARCSSFLAELDAPAVIITHGITSRVLRCLATGRPYGDFTEVGGGQGNVYLIREGRSSVLDIPE